MTSLWPTDLVTSPSAIGPRHVLLEQGRHLGEMTKNLIVAKVYVHNDGEFGDDAKVHLTFAIEAPTLPYRYRLFNLSYKIPDLYPIEVELDEDLARDVPPVHPSHPQGQVRLARSEEEFLSLLGQIFRAQKTRRLINAIRAQVEPLEGDDEVPF